MRPAVDLARVGDFLHDHCRSGVDLKGMEVTYVKLRRHGPLLAVLEAPAGAGPPAAFTARWENCSNGYRLEALLNDRYGSHDLGSRAGRLDRPAIYSAELGLLFTSFPFDRRLRSLPLVTDGEYMAERLESALAPFTNGLGIIGVDVRPVRYRPEGKCVFELTITWADNNPAVPCVIYGKVAKRSIFERSRAVHPHLKQIGAGSSFAVPKPLAVLDDLSLELWSRLGGVPMATLVGGPEHIGLGAAVGQALRSLHELPISLPHVRRTHHKTELVSDNSRQLARYLPSRAATAGRLRAEIIRRLDNLPAAAARPIHHDFHGHNVLVDHGSLGLIDFEDMAMGDCADDVGSMYGHLTNLAVRTPEMAAGIETERAAFIEAYDISTLGDRFETHAAMHCLLSGYQALRYPSTTSSPRAAAMLDSCERLLAGDHS